ncbi:hypothetical protein [Arcobacter sp. F2176]|uniref:hypothetical protein n=1 Tax=Arcobacter sp. F2176 TaxID=2044511 RepID=UPI00100A6D8D|nr:hypothetical protein [Arcobacter sp. F2176]RXJ79879.1 hypothetical protein CRU95_12840 [Arcobacter sp. F2176]
MQFQFNNTLVTIQEPTNIDFNLHNATHFLQEVYTYLYGLLNEDNGLFQINYDELDTNLIQRLIDENNPRIVLTKINGKKVSTTEWQNNPIQKAFVLFFSQFPDFNLLLKNLHTDPSINIKNAETLFGEAVSSQNFLNIKKQVDEINNLKWTREKSLPERQAGVSILGNISETLLETAMESLIDNTNFFRSQNHDVQSYGDFVLMCLPNNLWISVKSNFARERLLASGYTTDIIGVGYFTDYNEFTSQIKVRNFIKVGFLAMYIPNIPITESQITNDVSTYQEAVNYYNDNNRELPLNINGKPFLRPLSDLYHDLNTLLQIDDIKRRTTVRY